MAEDSPRPSAPLVTPATLEGRPLLTWAIFSSIVASTTCSAGAGAGVFFLPAVAPTIALLVALRLRSTARVVTLGFAAALWLLGLLFTILDAGVPWSLLGLSPRPILPMTVVTVLACLVAFALSAAVSRAEIVPQWWRAVPAVVTGVVLAALFAVAVFVWYASHANWAPLS